MIKRRFSSGRAWLFSLLTCLLIPSAVQASLHEVLVGPLRGRFAPFLDTVLRQVPSKDFFKMIDMIDQNYHPKSDIEWYTHISNHIASIKPVLSKYTPLYKLYALKSQRTALSNQLKNLMSTEQASGIETAVEIGKPGTYIASIRGHLPNLKQTIAINYAQQITDTVEGFSRQSPLTPYNKFVSLDDYKQITDIPKSSVDLIICTIGLHHAPVEKLDAFVASIRSILKPGGIFILRDHDVVDDSMLKIAHAAHSVFNAVLAEETLEDELKEYRNFQPLSYWIALLQKHGFAVGDERITQDGDPSMNTFIKAIAQPHNNDEYEAMMIHRLAQKPGHRRDIMQTYLTTPEWLSVDIPQEYGNFITHTPFYEFPWIASVRSFWKAFYASYTVAVRKRGVLPVLMSPYTQMNLFVGSTLTIEHVIKAIISAPIRYMFSGAEAETLQTVVYDPENEIGMLHPDIKILEVLENDLKLVEVPRYKQFLRAMLQLPGTNSLEFRTIGGQKTIMCKIRSKDNSHRLIERLLPDCVVEFEWTLPTQAAYTYAGITVPVTSLRQFVQHMREQNNELLYVHDF
ncbi:MAG TPA: class I SAM-dependent methyltransferase [Candidatus Babeliales bacterium]|nr:class I SAM-dependent methyltransferase [Candidatus Babeliales bacterium]